MEILENLDLEGLVCYDKKVSLLKVKTPIDLGRKYGFI